MPFPTLFRKRAAVSGAPTPPAPPPALGTPRLVSGFPPQTPVHLPINFSPFVNALAPLPAGTGLGFIAPENTVPAGQRILAPAAAPPWGTLSNVTTGVPLDVNERTDIMLPFGPGGGKRIGPGLYGGYTGLVG